jgi:hypothetical protein
MLLGAMILGQYSIFMFYHQANINDLMGVSEHLLEGVTHIRVFQNRLLGPALIKLLQHSLCSMQVSCEYSEAFKSYHLMMITICSCTFFFLSSKIINSVVPEENLNFLSKAGAIIAFTSIQLQMLGAWLQPWDYLDLLGFIILVCADYRRDKNYTFFWLLFIFWLSAKESAMFVPMWILLTRLDLKFKQCFSLKNLWARRLLLLQSFLMVIICIITTKYLRDHFWVHSTFTNVGTDDAHKVLGNLIGITDNYHRFRDALLELRHKKIDGWLYSSLYYVSFGLVYLVMRFLLVQKTSTQRQLFEVYNIMGIFFIMLWVIGSIPEPRLYLPLIPMFFVILMYSIEGVKKKHDGSLGY